MARQLTIATLSPSVARVVYLHGSEAYFTVSCTKREAEGCALVSVDGEAVGFLHKMDRNAWYFNRVRDMSNAESDSGVDIEARNQGARHLLCSHGSPAAKSASMALAQAGYCVVS